MRGSEKDRYIERERRSMNEKREVLSSKIKQLVDEGAASSR